jgi:ribose-phosphate pyrophosphokinase
VILKLNSHNSVLVAGSSHPQLAQEILHELKLLDITLPTLPITLFRFPDGEQRVQLGDSVLGKQAFVLQSLGKAPNELLIETLLIVDALRRGGAKHIVLICPYLAYSRQNVQETEGVSVAARLFADFLQTAGVGHLLTIDLHSELVGSFYSFPVEHLNARKAFCTIVKEQKLFSEDFVVVGPDLGASKLAAKFSRELGAGLALIEKRRDSARQVTMLSLLGEVVGKNVLLADDVCSTAGTLASASLICREKGAKRIFACVTHGLFTESALKRIEDSPIEKLFVSNTIAQEPLTSSKLCVVSIAKELALSLSRLLIQFEEQ